MARLFKKKRKRNQEYKCQKDYRKEAHEPTGTRTIVTNLHHKLTSIFRIRKAKQF